MNTIEKLKQSRELQNKIAHLDQIRQRLDIFRSERASLATWIVLYKILTTDDYAGITQNINAMRDGLGDLMETFVYELKNLHANDMTAEQLKEANHIVQKLEAIQEAIRIVNECWFGEQPNQQDQAKIIALLFNRDDSKINVKTCFLNGLREDEEFLREKLDNLILAL